MKRIVISVMLLGGLLFYLNAPNVFADSVKGILHTNETKVQSSLLKRGATKTEFHYTCGVLSTSKHPVTANYGCPGHERTKGLVNPGKTGTWILTESTYGYDSCRVILYGNTKAEPKKKCYATGILAQY